MTQDMNHTFRKALRAVLVAAMMSLTGSHTLAQVTVNGNVYGGGSLADVKTNTEVNMSSGIVKGNIYGGGKGKADNFTCDKAMVGTVDAGDPILHPDGYSDGNTTVTITNGTVEGDVYGGGEVGRVEMNTTVTIGEAGETSSTPIIKGHVFGAGKGEETHGYSALVRGNATVTIQGQAQVWQNVHGGGEKASVGRYYVAKDQNDADTYHVRIGMPCYLKAGGKCTVNIQDGAVIGKDDIDDSGDVFGAGQGIRPDYRETDDAVTGKKRSRRMNNKTSDYNDSNKAYWDYYVDDEGNEDIRYVWEYFKNNDDYLLYVETLARASETDVVIGGKRVDANTITPSSAAPTVKGSVYGGSESGFVYYGTLVNIPKGTVKGDAFGGGKGLESFAEAGRVRRNTNLTISGGTVEGNVYGGGSLGDVGYITKPADYNYTWSQNDGSTPNVANHNTKKTATNTGICTVKISGGTIGINGTVSDDHGNVFGAGKGLDHTWWCEKAMVFATNVSIKNSCTVHGNVYGGGQIGRVEDDAKVEIGTLNGSDVPDIKGDVFGAGAGIATHGYSALVRGNADVTVQGATQVRGNVYGGGEIASVGRFSLVKGLPVKPQSGGNCKVTIQDNAKIGSSGTDNDVYGACKGVDPTTITSSNRKSMQLFENRPKNPDGSYKTDGWVYYEDEDHQQDTRFVWVTYTADDYPTFLRTLALTSHPDVTIDDNAHVYGDVYGGGQRGLALGSVDVKIQGGTIHQDVYGGGALADTNSSHWDDTNNKLTNYIIVPGLTVGESSVSGYYVLNNGKYEQTSHTTAQESVDYYEFINYNTTVRLTGGKVLRNAYGGGLGDANNPAYVCGDVLLDLNGETTITDGEPTTEGTAITATKGCIVNQVFGCNNVNGSPKDDVIVHVYATQNASQATILPKYRLEDESLDKLDIAENTKETDDAYVTRLKAILADRIALAEALGGLTVSDDIKTLSTSDNATASGLKTAITTVTTSIKTKTTDEINAVRYDVKAVYGGGNQAAYNPYSPYTTSNTSGAKTQVIIEGCSETSIETVYGGGNAAAVPETNVEIKAAYEILNVFGGGNGKDAPAPGVENPGADVGTLDQGTSTYGTGNANTLLEGGVIHEVYGGSNQKGVIKGSINQTSEPEAYGCDLVMSKVVGAGKYADIDGDVNMTLSCQPSSKVPVLFAGADEANVNGNITLNITNGNFGQVFGGNNLGGAVKGKIVVNVKETGCQPIKIDELYLGGNEAPYSVFGYYESDETHEVTGKKILKPRVSATDGNLPVKHDGTKYGAIGDFTNYAQPILNVISCTYIGKVFGGGYGEGAKMYADPTLNINMIPGKYAAQIDRDGTPGDDNDENALGELVDVFGGGNQATVIGNPVVNIGSETTVDNQSVLGAYITGNVYGGGNKADVDGNTYVNISTKMTPVLNNNEPTGAYTYTKVDHSVTTDFKGLSIGTSVYGGGCEADVLGNTHVQMSDGYIFNGIFGGGYSGSVGTITERSLVNYDGTAHESHTGCVGGKPTKIAENTGKCTVVVTGGQIGPIEVATLGMNRKTNGHGDPVPQGWVWGAGCGVIADRETDPDTDFRTYVKETDVTIGGTAFILESIIGGGEFGRVLGNTLVKIEGGQIGVGEGKVTDGKPVRYTDAQFINPTTTPISTSNALTPCSTFPYGRNTGTEQTPVWVYDTYDPFADLVTGTKPYPGGSTDNASDGKTWIGCVFAGGSGYMPYTTKDNEENITGYDWLQSAGCVEGNAEVRISGGHILTNVYGGNEYTDVKGKCIVKMTDGTVGVPRTVDQILKNPMIGHVFGAGKGDPRVHFNKVTNVGDVEVEITGGIVYGSVFGGGEDGHVLRNVTMTIGKQTTTGEGNNAVTTKSGPIIGTWGTTYIDGNVFGGGRGYNGDAYTAGNVAGCVDVDIKGGNILGSVYGGGQLGSVGYGLFDEGTTGYGEMRADSDTETGFTPSGGFTKGRGHIELTISGGTIGNDHEYIYPKTGSGGNIPSTISETDFTKWSDADWTTWKNHNNIPKTEFDTSTGRVSHTKGGNVFAGGMGRMYQLDGTTPISAVDWWKMGCVKSTKLTITGGTIKSTVFGGGELGQVVGYHTAKNAANENVNVGTEVIINGGTIGTEIQESVTTGTGESATTTNYTRFIYGSVFGGGYGSLIDKLTHNKGASNESESYPKYIAGRVKAGTKVEMAAGSVMASVYGGGKMAAVGESKTLGEDLTIGHTGDTHVIISGGTIGKSGFGGAKVGNVYGGGSGHNNTVRSGHIYGNTNVTISDGTIFHNVYGGGAYGSVGDFTYSTEYDEEAEAYKVSGISNLHSDHSNSGVARVSITGGTIGYDGKENGMVFGSSRGDINEPGQRDDYTAWVYDANVTIGDANSGPAIKGSVYGSGENGHTFNNSVVTVNKGTIGIADSSDPGYKVTSNGTEYSGAAYPYRGNVYGGGCGTDKYYEVHTQETHDGNGQLFNPLAGIVYGNATVNINGGTVVRNVYGAGAMGSVGRLVTTSTTEDETTTTTTSTTGGTTTINISGGTIGVSGTVGDGNVFGAARGDVNAISNEAALVRKNTDVSITGGSIKGNVYGGGELGCVGTYVFTNDMKNFYWTNEELEANKTSYTYNNTGVCNVTISGGTIGTGVDPSDDGTFVNGNVFGAGKGVEDTWWCEKAIAYKSNVTITDGTIKGTVYGGGQVGRVETDATVKIGTENATEGTRKPDITGNVFGAGAGVMTHGYSALVRGNATVTVQGVSQVGGSVYGGGEIASVGKFTVIDGLPKHPDSGGTCRVTIQDKAMIGAGGTGHNVFGACKGVTPAYSNDPEDPNRSKSMQLFANAPSDESLWSYYEPDHTYIWRYYPDEAAYLDFLETLALTSHPIVTIAEDATVNGSVFGGGERGITLGSVEVNINGGTVTEDVYGGGALANTNKGNWDDSQYVEVTGLTEGHTITDLYTRTGGSGTADNPYIYAEATEATAANGKTYYSRGNWVTDKYDATTHATTYKTNVTLTGGEINGNVYGGGLGQIAREASATVTKLDEVKAKVYGDVLVNLNGTPVAPAVEGGAITYTPTGICKVHGNIFGCNNQNGSPQSSVTVHVHKTEGWEGHMRTGAGLETPEAVTAALNDPVDSHHSYELKGVYGGGNLSAYYPDLKATRDTVQAYVIIDGCDLTSIQTVYGGGNAASTPATNITINATYEIEEVFGGGDGHGFMDPPTNSIKNPGANVGYEAYPTEYDIPESSKDDRTAKFSYGSGKASVTIYDGLIHRVFGGSNTKGNVRESAVTLLDDMAGCHFQVDEAYGGGKNAPMDAEAKLLMACIPGLKVAYGGAQEADVLGGVTMTITNGTYERVFGGNNISGTIQGPIVVNVEETGCRPIIIGELYGGGNRAGYSVYGYNGRTPIEPGENVTRKWADPQVNVKSFTSIGNLYGGGYGETAVMVGNPTVNINVVKGKYSGQTSDNYFTGFTPDADNKRYFKLIGDNTVYVPAHEENTIGAIYNVFGGGNAAKVIGNTNVNIGTEAGEEVYVEVAVTTGTSVEGYYTYSEGNYHEASGTAFAGTTYYQKTVKGADVRGNVYGGGNAAEVTGDTNVTIGKKATP